MIEEPKAIQLKVSLKGSNPLIWRRILIKSDTDFLQLHESLQTAMGWENYHLYSFRVDDYTITEINEEFDDYGPNDSKSIDVEDISLHEALIKSGVEKFTYEYDFGDSWLHDIEVEKIRDLDDKHDYPFCVAGEMNCPPEDCGGIPGFYNLLGILKDTKHPEHAQMKEWLGEEYDPEEFSMDKVNLMFALGETPGMDDDFDDDDSYEDYTDFDDELIFGPLKIPIVNKSKHGLPEYAFEDAAGMDLRANLEENTILKPMQRAVVKTGLFMAIPFGYEGQVRPRSGLAAKHGITVLNAPGTIDSDFRGEIGVILINLSNEDFEIKDGDRIAQLVIARYEKAVWNPMENLDESPRGEGGFGSTGF